VTCAKLSAAADTLKDAVAARVAAEMEWAEAQGRARKAEYEAYDTYPGQAEAEAAPAVRVARSKDGPLLTAIRAESYAEGVYRSALALVARNAIAPFPPPRAIPCACSACDRAAGKSSYD
jgi:hypothetical protein